MDRSVASPTSALGADYSYGSLRPSYWGEERVVESDCLIVFYFAFVLVFASAVQVLVSVSTTALALSYG